MNTRKYIAALTVAAALLPMAAFAQTTDLQSQVQSLLGQIKALQQQLMTLIASSSASGAGWMASSTPQRDGDKSEGQGVRPCIALVRNIRQGQSGDDIKQLQQILKDDPESGFNADITGFFGALTAKAMANFQMRMGIASSTDGSVGPMTRGFFERECNKGPGMGGNPPPGPMPGGARVSGTVTANSGSSITIQNNDKKSVVVNITASTTIQTGSWGSAPPTPGSVSDLAIGKSVMAEGSQNTDGSIQAIRINVGNLPPTPPPTPLQQLLNGGGDGRGEHTMTPPPSLGSGTTTPPGGHCGGFIANAPVCSSGYHCQLNIVADTGGTCVANGGSGSGNSN